MEPPARPVQDIDILTDEFELVLRDLQARISPLEGRFLFGLQETEDKGGGFLGGVPGKAAVEGGKIPENIAPPEKHALEPLFVGMCRGIIRNQGFLVDMAMGQNLCLHCGADELPCATYFDVHQGFPGF